ncbi:hypothetical protein RI367_006974 [Sorochytrium milnesiophthora]
MTKFLSRAFEQDLYSTANSEPILAASPSVVSFRWRTQARKLQLVNYERWPQDGERVHTSLSVVVSDGQWFIPATFTEGAIDDYEAQPHDTHQAITNLQRALIIVVDYRYGIHRLHKGGSAAASSVDASATYLSPSQWRVHMEIGRFKVVQGSLVHGAVNEPLNIRSCPALPAIMTLMLDKAARRLAQAQQTDNPLEAGSLALLKPPSFCMDGISQSTDDCRSLADLLTQSQMNSPILSHDSLVAPSPPMSSGQSASLSGITNAQHAVSVALPENENWCTDDDWNDFHLDDDACTISDADARELDAMPGTTWQQMQRTKAPMPSLVSGVLEQHMVEARCGPMRLELRLNICTLFLLTGMASAGAAQANQKYRGFSQYLGGGSGRSDAASRQLSSGELMEKMKQKMDFASLPCTPSASSVSSLHVSSQALGMPSLNFESSGAVILTNETALTSSSSSSGDSTVSNHHQLALTLTPSQTLPSAQSGKRGRTLVLGKAPDDRWLVVFYNARAPPCCHSQMNPVTGQFVAGCAARGDKECRNRKRRRMSPEKS